MRFCIVAEAAGPVSGSSAGPCPGESSSTIVAPALCSSELSESGMVSHFGVRNEVVVLLLMVVKKK